MKKNLLITSLIFSILIIFTSCESKKTSENPAGPNFGTVTITGKVISDNGDALGNATVKVSDGDTTVGAVTDPNGEFVAGLSIDKDKDLVIIIAKPGFVSDTLSVFGTKDATIQLPVVQLKADKSKDNLGNSTSGAAASIYLYSQSADNIGVKESGSAETARIVFEVQDSSGKAIDLNHAVTVNFLFGSQPGGGEYLFPNSAETNALGRAEVVLNTGTIAGVVQIVADINTPTGIIKSKPVLIAIHGGLPDQGHFGVASDKLNYPVYGIIGFKIDFTAYVGDKFSNPVRTGTAVYFNATSGIIEGSNLTTELGTATVTLLTQPFPNDPVYGPGFFTVTASTADENLNTITTQSVRLASGSPIITITPTTVNIDNGGSQVFNYTCADFNGNPLSEGTSIKVSTEGDIDVVGDIDVKLPDTQSKSYTTFSFIAFDTRSDTLNAQQAAITIKTTGQNGEDQLTITGTSK